MCELYNLDDFRRAITPDASVAVTYKERFKEHVKSTLSCEDYQKFSDALTNLDIYDMLDDDIKDLVDAYYLQSFPIHELNITQNEGVCFN